MSKRKKNTPINMPVFLGEFPIIFFVLFVFFIFLLLVSIVFLPLSASVVFNVCFLLSFLSLSSSLNVGFLRREAVEG